MKLIVLATLLLSMAAHAVLIKNYDYPIEDSFVATLTAGNIKPEWSLELEILEIRMRAGLKMRYSLFEGDAGNDLIFLHSGLASSHAAEKAIWLAQHINKRGYHVVVLTSPLFPDNMMAFSGRHYGGLLDKDGLRLYKKQIRIIEVLKQRGLQFESVSQMGYSMGGTHAVFVAMADQQYKKIQFKRTVSINPALDLGYGIHALDDMQNTSLGFFDRASTLVQALKGVQNYTSDEPLYSNSYFAAMQDGNQFTREQARFVLGYHYKDIAPGLHKAARQVKERYYPLRDCVAGRAIKSIFDYVKFAVLPYAKNRKHDCELSRVEDDANELMSDYRLQNHGKYLSEDSSLYIFANQDDFLMQDGDVEFLEQVMPERVYIFPRGGHFGNVWHKTNMRLLFDVLSE